MCTLANMYSLVSLILRPACGRVESGLDDPDIVGYLGHFFDGSSGPTKLSECDPDFLVH